MSGMGTTEDRRVVCSCCGSWWQERDIYVWWPIRFALQRDMSMNSWRPARWGVQIGQIRVGEMVIRSVFSFGPFRVIFGPEKFVSPSSVVPTDKDHNGQWLLQPMWSVERFKKRQRDKEFEVSP